MNKTKTETLKEKRLLSVSEAAEYIGQGQTAARQYFKSINALRHFGRRVLIDKAVVDAALNKMALTAAASED